MARSKLIKEFVSEEISLQNTLMRLKVILSDLDSEEINQWINFELTGYPEEVELPPYRCFEGNPIGTFIVGKYGHGMQYKNAPIPLSHLSSEDRKSLILIKIRDGISGVQRLKDSQNTIARTIPTEYCHSISGGNLTIQGMTIQCSPNQFEDIVSSIKNMVLDILIELEKEFGILDSLDIFSESTDEDKAQSIASFITNLVYNDHSIEIGNGNTLKSTDIGHTR
ncbi:hypothetical protein NDQ53_14400 [Rossellomorea marisflavi]|uniref:AbiTii domain-containing protein n=1 Tax=Rossellomorea marisflavi TaxID=189381 RepID=UPI00203D3455|nr:hypothetical protein [Rossellomorea marisflavi]MCM2590490.1 hypothetical protein [Rossellomorea marisflavi]